MFQGVKVIVIPVLEEDNTVDNSNTNKTRTSITCVYGIGVSIPCLNAKAKHVVES
jgi:hypothetical protein